LNFYWAPFSDGLGDLLIGLPALKALIRTGTPTYLVIRSPKQVQVVDLVPGLAGAVREPEFLARERGAGHLFINMRDHPLQRDHMFGSDAFFKAFGQVTVVECFKNICQDMLERPLGISVDFSYEPFPFKHNEKAAGKVILVPGSAGRYKCWPAKNWSELLRRLQERGLESVVVGQPERSAEVAELVDLGFPFLATPDLVTAIDVLSSAHAVISVDTGLMHLAVQQQKPTVAMHMNRSIFARVEAACCRPIFADDCIPECLGWMDVKPNSVLFEKFEWQEFLPCHQQESCKKIANIGVDTILKNFDELVAAQVR
jgi:hypothetical protein